VSVERWDAVVVGAGPAGLNAALVLGRARRRVLVVDAGRPANPGTAVIGGLVGHGGTLDGLRRAGRRQLTALPSVTVLDTDVVTARADDLGATLELAEGAEHRTRALVLAHGLRYDTPAIDGLADFWGRSVHHCPFCDGWEVRDGRVAVHGGDDDAARLALHVREYTDDVVLCTDGPPAYGPHAAALLEAAGVRIRPEPVVRLDGRRGHLRRIILAGGGDEPREALFVVTRGRQPNGLAAALGCELEAGGGVLSVDGWGRTTTPGVYAAGDTAAVAGRSVATALGSGSRVAQAVVNDARAARERRPVTHRRRDRAAGAVPRVRAA